MFSIVSPKAHSDNEHTIVSLLNGTCLEQAIKLQNKLGQMLGDSIWLQEPKSLHITLMEIVCDTDYGSISRKEVFEQWYIENNETVKNIIAGIPEFEVTFSELLVSQRAIIIKSRESNELNYIRKQILSKTKLPRSTKLPPDITHSTLARFAKSIDIDELSDKLKYINFSGKQQISEFVLAKDLVPPLFKPSITERYELGKAV